MEIDDVHIICEKKIEKLWNVCKYTHNAKRRSFLLD
jgi:hypothetical protein